MTADSGASIHSRAGDAKARDAPRLPAGVDPEQFDAAIRAFRKQLTERPSAPPGGWGSRKRGGQPSVRGGLPIPPPPIDRTYRAWPFAVWDFRKHRTMNASFLLDSQVGEEECSAWFTIHEDESLSHNEIVFWYFWQNDRNRDVNVNVVTSLTADMLCHLWADNGYIRTPFWGGGTNGKARLKVIAELRVMQWWHSPPVEVPKQAACVQEIRDKSISGGFVYDTTADLPVDAETYYLHNDGIVVPPAGGLLIEPSFNFYYEGSEGSYTINPSASDQERRSICSYVEIQEMS